MKLEKIGGGGAVDSEEIWKDVEGVNRNEKRCPLFLFMLKRVCRS